MKSEIEWDDAKDYIESGCLDSMSLSTDLQSVTLEITYWDGKANLGLFRVTCHGCCYLSVRRVPFETDEMILEAHVHSVSPLIDALNRHELDVKLGPLTLPQTADPGAIVKHLEIVSQSTIDVLCSNMTIKVDWRSVGPKKDSQACL